MPPQINFKIFWNFIKLSFDLSAVFKFNKFNWERSFLGKPLITRSHFQPEGDWNPLQNGLGLNQYWAQPHEAPNCLIFYQYIVWLSSTFFLTRFCQTLYTLRSIVCIWLLWGKLLRHWPQMFLFIPTEATGLIDCFIVMERDCRHSELKSDFINQLYTGFSPEAYFKPVIPIQS